MAVSVGPAEGEGEEMSDINVVPLTDVMLVMLIIFILTVPVVTQHVPLVLPKVAYQPTQDKPENVQLSVKGEGGTCKVYWGMTPVTSQQLLDRAVATLKDEINKVGGIQNITEDNMPEAHIRGDINTPYKCIGGTIVTMQRAGFQKIGFISNPPPLTGVKE
jgi:biopolymer transport protein ExbD